MVQLPPGVWVAYQTVLVPEAHPDGENHVDLVLTTTARSRVVESHLDRASGDGMDGLLSVPSLSLRCLRLDAQQSQPYVSRPQHTSGKGANKLFMISLLVYVCDKAFPLCA